MEIEQFRQAIKLGRGRAILYLKEHPWEPHVQAIEHVCLHNTAYDPQCEDPRAEYVYEIVQLTKQPQRFADIVTAELLKATDFWDTYHLFDLARLFATNGHGNARNAMYEKFRRDDAEEHFLGESQLIKLDGVKGLLVVLDRVGKWLETNPDYWVDDRLILEAEESLGKPAMDTVDAAAGTNANICRYMEAVRKFRGTPRQRQTPDFHHFSYSELREWIAANHGDAPVSLFGWGKRAPDDALREAATDLLNADEGHLLAYVRIFAWRAFPLDPQRLIHLACSNNEKLARAAKRALQHVQCSAVRELAIHLIREGQVDGNVIKLLARNYQAGDDLRIEFLLANAAGEDQFHGIAQAAIRIFEDNPDAEVLPSLLRVYEQCRCSLCRMGAVTVLMTRGLIPGWMLAECRYDSDRETRERARKHNDGVSQSTCSL